MQTEDCQTPVPAVGKPGNPGIHIVHLLSPLPDIHCKVIKRDLFSPIHKQGKNRVAAIHAINVGHKDIRNDQHNSDRDQSAQYITPRKERLQRIPEKLQKVLKSIGRRRQTYHPRSRRPGTAADPAQSTGQDRHISGPSSIGENERSSKAGI